MEYEEEAKFSLDQLKEEIRLLQEELFLVKGELESLKLEIRANIKPNFTNRSSIGNEGVPANQQTDRQSFDTPLFPVDGDSLLPYSLIPETPTDTPTHPQHIEEKVQQIPLKVEHKVQQITPEMVRKILEEEEAKKPVFQYREPEKVEKDPLADLTEVMNSLKSDLRRKFRSLTKQEFYIFSVLFTVEKSQEMVTYSDLASKTGLTGSSIRDYIQRIIRKGIPLTKEKVNNKITTLKVPQELRNLATLDNLMRIRDDLRDESLESFSKR